MTEESPLLPLVLRYQQARSCNEREDSAEAIVFRAEPDLWLYLLGRCEESAVEDILQETWMGIFLKLDFFEGEAEGQIWAWIYLILDRKLVDHWRKQSRNPAVPWKDSETLLAIIEKSVADHALTPRERCLLKDALEQLRQAAPLAAEYLWTHCIVGLTYTEIGKRHGVLEDVVRMRIARGVEKLKKREAKGD